MELTFLWERQKINTQANKDVGKLYMLRKIQNDKKLVSEQGAGEQRSL